MPSDYNPVPTAMPASLTVTTLVDGDAVNRDNLYKELSPGVKPKLTLALLLDYLAGFIRPGSQTRTASTRPIDWTNGTVLIETASLTAGDGVYHYLDLPHGSTLTAASSYILPGSHGALPATMPTLAVEKVQTASGSVTTVHSPVTDSSATTGAYDVAHAITISGMTEVIDRTAYVYRVAYTNEASTNSTNNVKFLGTIYTVTV